MEVTHRELLSTRSISETSLKTIGDDFQVLNDQDSKYWLINYLSSIKQESWNVLDKVPKEKYHSYSKYIEGLLHLSLQVASKLYNFQIGLQLVRQLLEKNVAIADIFKRICPEVVLNWRFETANTCLIYTLTDLKEFEKAMMEIARAIASFPSSSEFLSQFFKKKVKSYD
jgi:hypothetical protein